MLDNIKPVTYLKVIFAFALVGQWGFFNWVFSDIIWLNITFCAIGGATCGWSYAVVKDKINRPDIRLIQSIE